MASNTLHIGVDVGGTRIKFGLVKAATDGEPIVRHMEYAFPNEGFESSNDQFMLGDKYFVTPMIEKRTSRTVKLPKGDWVDELGNKFKGGKIITIDVPLSRLPYFMLQNKK